EPVAPGTEHRGSVSALGGRRVTLVGLGLEDDLERFAVHLYFGIQRPVFEYGSVVAVAFFLLPFAKLGREPDCVVAIEVDATPWDQVEPIAEPRHELPVLLSFSDGNLLAEQYDHVAVDARDGRIAVHERGQDGKRVAAMREIHRDAEL